MDSEYVDVLVIGAGLSGIGAGAHLQERCPGKTYAILEARETLGGTWDLFRYPGVRSDSDMYTLGYSYKPWENAKSIADGPSILEYVREAAEENDVESKIRFQHKVVHANWSTPDARWNVEAQRTDTGETVHFSCGFLLSCTGYYRYDQGFLPDFKGTDRFKGRMVHPQFWSDDIDYAGKRVVVIGSGATAVTLVPAMAKDAAHVTMLQRSPTYIIAMPGEDPVNKLARKLPRKLAYSIMRWKNVFLTMLSFVVSRRRPRLMKAILRKGVELQLPKGYDIDKHFKPTYNPWDQRLCLVPDGDLFKTISSGDAEVVTDTIDTFTETGIKLTSGQELEADLVVTATGLDLIPLGGLNVSVDGEAVPIPERLMYKGMMLEGVPNAAVAIGYTNASWTLKCDLTHEYVCRLINYMDEHGYRQCMPVNNDPSVSAQPFIDFNSGYVLRAIDKFPKQGNKAPWRLYQNYPRDILSLRRGSLEDGAMQFSSPEPAAAGSPEQQVAA